MKAPGFFTWMLPTLLLAVLALAFARWQTTLNERHMADLAEKTAARIALAVSEHGDAGTVPEPATRHALEALATSQVRYVAIELPGQTLREFGAREGLDELVSQTVALRDGGRVVVATASVGWVAMWPLAVAAVTGTAILLTLRLALFVRRREHHALAGLDRLARDIDHDGRAPTARRFDDMQTAVEELTSRIHAFRSEVREELDRSTQALRSTLAESRGRNDELEIAKREAQVASQAKTELLASISHEVRTPMDAILGYAELLAETPLDLRQRSYLNAIEQASENLLDIVDDVLNLSRIEAGKLTIHDQPFSIRETVDSVAQMLAPSAYRKALDFVRIVAADVPATVRGDPLRLRQVLVNLLTNAIKFSPAGHVRLLVEVHDTDGDTATVSFAVSDTGIGISADEQQALFEPFARLAHDTVDAQGTGLGLVITKRLCEAMRGDVSVASSPGRGSTFTARIPMSVIRQSPELPPPVLAGAAIALCCRDAAQRAFLTQCLDGDGATVRHIETIADLTRNAATADCAIAVLVLRHDDLRDRDALARAGRAIREHIGVVALASTSSRSRLRDIERLFGGEALPAHTPMPIVCERIAAALERPAESVEPPARTNNDPAALGGTRVLVAEDNRFSRGYLRSLLTSNGAEVVACANGDEALAVLQESEFDFVLMDLRMPVCGGIAAMRKLRASGASHPPVIGMTAAADECDAAREAGMTECIVKPVRAAFLLELVGRLRESPPPASRSFVLDAEMRNELARELPRHAQRLRTLLAAHDRGALLEEAHRINGTAALCGFETLRACAAHLEGRLRDDDDEDLEGRVASVVEQLERVHATL